jgi:hypothetical protein
MSREPEEYVLSLRRRSRNPTWLKPYQERLARANARAAAETRHLQGSVRFIAMNLLASKYFKEDQE